MLRNTTSLNLLFTTATGILQIDGIYSILNLRFHSFCVEENLSFTTATSIPQIDGIDVSSGGPQPTIRARSIKDSNDDSIWWQFKHSSKINEFRYPNTMGKTCDSHRI